MVGLIVVEATVRLGYAVFTYATLAFLGVTGENPTDPNWAVDVSDPAFRAAFDADVVEKLAARDKQFRKTHVDVVEITTDEPYADRLMRFFRKRAKRLR